MFKEMLSNSYLYGANAPFIEQLYESYLADPASVEPRWRDYFEELQRIEQGPRDVAHRRDCERVRHFRLHRSQRAGARRRALRENVPPDRGRGALSLRTRSQGGEAIRCRRRIAVSMSSNPSAPSPRSRKGHVSSR